MLPHGNSNLQYVLVYLWSNRRLQNNATCVRYIALLLSGTHVQFYFCVLLSYFSDLLFFLLFTPHVIKTVQVVCAHFTDFQVRWSWNCPCAYLSTAPWRPADDTILDLGWVEWSASWPDRFTLGVGGNPPVPIGYEAGWATEPVGTLWRREKSLAPPGNRTPAAQSVG
jgi:hypothetical protein